MLVRICITTRLCVVNQNPQSLLTGASIKGNTVRLVEKLKASFHVSIFWKGPGLCGPLMCFQAFNQL